MRPSGQLTDHISLTHWRQRIEMPARRFDGAVARSRSPRALLLFVMFLVWTIASLENDAPSFWVSIQLCPFPTLVYVGKKPAGA